MEGKKIASRTKPPLANESSNKNKTRPQPQQKCDLPKKVLKNKNAGDNHTAGGGRMHKQQRLPCNVPSSNLKENIGLKVVANSGQNANWQLTQNSCKQVGASSPFGKPAALKGKTAKAKPHAGKCEHAYIIPTEVLDDLASRFIINVPQIERSDIIRLCFQVELAHWFYLDFFCSEEQSLQLQEQLQSIPIVPFAYQLFKHVPFLHTYSMTAEKIIEEWKSYKMRVPTYGAILLSEDLSQCLLVQSYACKNSWGFPKGKVNENEKPVVCAIREVYEETGYDISHKIRNRDYIEETINFQTNRLYIVQDVPLDTQFVPQARNEIRSCTWFNIDALPTRRDDQTAKSRLGFNGNSFYTVIPFVKQLQQLARQRRELKNITHVSQIENIGTAAHPAQVVEPKTDVLLADDKSLAVVPPYQGANNENRSVLSTILGLANKANPSIQSTEQVSNSILHESTRFMLQQNIYIDNRITNTNYNNFLHVANNGQSEPQLTFKNLHPTDKKLLRTNSQTDKASSNAEILDYLATQQIPYRPHEKFRQLPKWIAHKEALNCDQASNLPIEMKHGGLLRRATSHEPTRLSDQAEAKTPLFNQHQTQFALKSSSWTNFKFDKDFLATIFD